MNEANTKKLLDEFRFFKSTIHNSNTAISVWGFECGDGWFELIWKLSEDLKEMNKHIIRTPEDPFQVLQVKEKFGGLRFYTNTASDEMFKRILKAEHDSFSICENCGKEGCLRTEGWAKTLCNECAEAFYIEDCRTCHLCHEAPIEELLAEADKRKDPYDSSV